MHAHRQPPAGKGGGRQVNERKQCEAKNDKGYICTLPPHHDGEHVAHGTDSNDVCARWSHTPSAAQNECSHAPITNEVEEGMSRIRWALAKSYNNAVQVFADICQQRIQAAEAAALERAAQVVEGYGVLGYLGAAAKAIRALIGSGQSALEAHTKVLQLIATRDGLRQAYGLLSFAENQNAQTAAFHEIGQRIAKLDNMVTELTAARGEGGTMT